METKRDKEVVCKEKQERLQRAFLHMVEEMVKHDVDFPTEFQPHFSINHVQGGKIGNNITIRPHTTVKCATSACKKNDESTEGGKYWWKSEWHVVAAGSGYYTGDEDFLTLPTTTYHFD